MAHGFGTEFGGWACPQCGFQPGAGAWQAGMMPTGPLPGTMPGMMYGQPYGPSFMPGPFAPGWTAWGPDFATYSAGGVPDDEDLEQMVYDALDADPSIPYDADIDVEVMGGVVMLSGTVPNKRVKHAAGDDAWWIPDVLDVNNQLQVTPRRERRRERTGTPETGATTRRTTGTMTGTAPTGRRSGGTTTGTMGETGGTTGTMTGRRTPGRTTGTSPRTR